MRDYTDVENISIVEELDRVTFRCEDGSTADLPRDVVANSSLLHGALSDVCPGNEVILRLPRGVLQKWLQCVGEEPYVLQLLL